MRRRSLRSLLLTTVSGWALHCAGIPRTFDLDFQLGEPLTLGFDFAQD